MSNYFQPSITIDAANVTDHSGMAGLAVTMAMPANVDRLGFMLQNISDTNDLWWGYDNGVAVGAAGYFCLTPRGTGDGKSSMFITPVNGAWRGAIYVVSDAGGRYTLKEWTQV